MTEFRLHLHDRPSSARAIGIYLYQLGGTLIFEVFRDPFSESKTREKDEAKKAREREPSSPTGDRRAPAGSLGAPEPSVLDRCCLWEFSSAGHSIETVIRSELPIRRGVRNKRGFMAI